jgi:hypothetical protein
MTSRPPTKSQKKRYDRLALLASRGNYRANAISENEPNCEPDCESDCEFRHDITKRPIVRMGLGLFFAPCRSKRGFEGVIAALAVGAGNKACTH